MEANMMVGDRRVEPFGMGTMLPGWRFSERLGRLLLSNVAAGERHSPERALELLAMISCSLLPWSREAGTARRGCPPPSKAGRMPGRFRTHRIRLKK